MSGTASASPGVRLDVWLDVACVCKTRSDAKRACEGGKVEVNGESAKPHRLVHPGDRVRVTRPLGRRQLVVVKQLADQHIPKAEARLLYDDITPPPSPEEAALREFDRLLRRSAPQRQAGSPGRDERRRLRRAKEGESE
jgi:ribosome-associated heat shock protein Hsp15